MKPRNPPRRRRRPGKIAAASSAAAAPPVLPKDILENYDLLKLLLSIKDPRARGIMLKTADPKLTRCIESIAKNLNSGALLQKPTPILVRLIQKHKKCLDRLAKPTVSLQAKQRLLAHRQTGGFLSFLLKALPAIASVAGGLLSSVVSSSSKK